MLMLSSLHRCLCVCVFLIEGRGLGRRVYRGWGAEGGCLAMEVEVGASSHPLGSFVTRIKDNGYSWMTKCAV